MHPKTYRLVTEYNGEIEFDATSLEAAAVAAKSHVGDGELCVLQMKGAKIVHFYKRGKEAMWPLSPKAAALEYALMLSKEREGGRHDAT